MRLQRRGRCQTAGLQGAGGRSRHSHQCTDVGSGVGEAGEASLFSLGSGSALPGLPPTPLPYPPPLCRPTPQTPQTLTLVFNLSPPQPPLSSAGRYRRHSCPLSRPLSRGEGPERAPSWVGIGLGCVSSRLGPCYSAEASPKEAQPVLSLWNIIFSGVSSCF